MMKLMLTAAAALMIAGSVSANSGGPSGIFSSEGFGFNRNNGSFGGCQSAGQGFAGNTGCNSGAASEFQSFTGVQGFGDINAGNFQQRQRVGSYNQGSFGIWDTSRGGNTDVLAIGNGGQGQQQSNSFQGYQFQGQGEYQSTTQSRGANFVNSFSNFSGAPWW